MDLRLASHSSYPRIGDSPEYKVLRREIRLHENGEASEAEVRAAEERMTGYALDEQTGAGLEIVTDGQIHWYDPVSHIAGNLDGVRIDGLLRFFDKFLFSAAGGSVRCKTQPVARR